MCTCIYSIKGFLDVNQQNFRFNKARIIVAGSTFRTVKCSSGNELHSDFEVVLDGIGSVSYEVPDSLVPVMKQRNGAICKGDCAALG